MNGKKTLRWVTAAVLSAAITLPCLAQEKDKPKAKATGQPNESEMMAMMMEMAKPGENHRLLAQGVGTWDYHVKAWMSPDPNAAPTQSSGSSVTRAVLDGRFFVSEHTGKMAMPGPDGKMTEMDFKGIGTEGYDNVQKKFVATWMDNMGTMIMHLDGTYDAATKTFTYRGEYEMMPGMKTKVRERIKVIDPKHRLMEFFEDRGGTEVRTLEIGYSRKG
jgi:hypothetical protein